MRLWVGLNTDKMSGLVGYLRKQSKPKTNKKKQKRDDKSTLRKRVEQGLAGVKRAESASLEAKSRVAVP